MRGLWWSGAIVCIRIIGGRGIRLLSCTRSASATFVGPICFIAIVTLILLSTSTNSETTADIRLSGSGHWLRTGGT